VTVDRPLGSRHPRYGDIVYPVNYGSVAGTVAADGEPIDAYVLGVDVPLAEFSGVVVGLVLRRDDVEDKLVVAPAGCRYSAEEIQDLVDFQERFFESQIVVAPQLAPDDRGPDYDQAMLPEARRPDRDNGQMVVSALSPDDWREYRSLRLEALQNEPAAFSSTYAEMLDQPDEFWRARLTDLQCAVLMARSGSQPVGMVGAYLGTADGDARVAVVFGMYVSEVFRRRGLGRALLTAIVDRVSAYPEIDAIRLWVTETQEPAVRLYESFGFCVVGKDEQSVNADGQDLDVLIMERPVRHVSHTA
jgi:inorganic pyrophosphatase